MVSHFSDSNDFGSRFNNAERYALALAGIGLLVLLLTAARLSPDIRGYGTHEQLGMGECFMVAHWGVRCPSCGMTTSWANLLDGRLLAAIASNAGGTLLGGLAILAAPWLLASAAAGQWCYLRPRTGLVIPAIALVMLVVSIQWMQHTGLTLLRQKLL